MSSVCREVAVREYSLDVQARAYAALYETLLARAKNPANVAAEPPLVPNRPAVMSD